MSAAPPPRLLVLACAALVGASCAPDGGSEPAGPSVESVAGSPAMAKAGQQVTGSAYITLVGFGDAKERYEFHAIRRPNGEVSGGFELYSTQSGGLRVSGSLVCFGIFPLQSGRFANLAGTITASSDPALAGLNVAWTVEDHGEGVGAPPDAASDLVIFSRSELEPFCAGPQAFGGFPSERANVQIHE